MNTSFLLHIDTSGPKCLVALSEDGKVIASLQDDKDKNHVAIVHEYIERLLALAQISWAQISGVAVVSGPGSYTGLRLGLSIAKGFCFGLDKPLIMHDVLTLLAHTYLQQMAVKEVLVVVPARKEEYFIAHYNVNGEALLRPMHVAHNELLKMKHLCSLPVLYYDQNGQGNLPTPLTDAIKNMTTVSNEYLNVWAKIAFGALQKEQFCDLEIAEPLYLKGVFIQ